MTPFLAQNNARNKRLCHAVLVCEILLAHATLVISPANFNYIIIGQLRPRMINSLGAIISRPASLFGGFIGAIVGVSPEPKVGRIATRRVVATMQYQHPDRDRANDDSPGESMSAKVAMQATQAISPIAKFVRCALPKPAGIRSATLIHLGPKPADFFFGKLGMRHSDLLSRSGCAVPGAFAALPGLFASRKYPTFGFITSLFGNKALFVQA